MGLVRKYISACTAGIVPWYSPQEKALNMARRSNRQTRRHMKKKEFIQEQMLNEQRRANDIRERELVMSHPPMEDPPTDEERARMFPEFERDTRRVSGTPRFSGFSDWWGYSNPKDKR